MLLLPKNSLELLVPISHDFPCGVFLKEADNNAYRLLRNDFNLAQMALRKLSQNPDVADIDYLRDENREKWSLLSDQLFDLFKTRTKDIELISWFICSQLILDNSLESVANSLSWFSTLVEQEWSTLNPILSKDKHLDVAEQEKVNLLNVMRIKAFSQLSGDSETSSLLFAPLLFQPLLGNISFFNYKSVERKGKLNELKLSALPFIEHERGVIRTRLDNVARCLVAITKLESFLAKQFNKKNATGMSFGYLKKLFSTVETALIFLSGFSTTKPIAGIELEKGQKDTHQYSRLSSSRGILNRDAAFHNLREIADYFLQREPHSPISYLLEKAIYWGYLSLPELLKEILAEQNEDVIIKILNSAGLNQHERISLPQLSEEKMENSFEKKSNSLIIEPESKKKYEALKNSEQESSEKSISSISTTALSW